MTTPTEPPPARSRRVVRCAAALVLGVLTTVGAAWLCARAGEREFRAGLFRTNSGKGVYRHAPESKFEPLVDWYGGADEAWERPILARMLPVVTRPHEPVEVSLHEYRSSSFGCVRTTVGLILRSFHSRDSDDAGDYIGPDPYVINHVESGWPFRAFWAEQSGEGRPPLRWANAESSNTGDAALLFADPLTDVSQVGWSGPLGHPLPINPLWLSALANTLFYAGLWWGVLAAVPAAWRRLRRPRAGCPVCGYDAGPLPRCPECGIPRSGIGTSVS